MFDDRSRWADGRPSGVERALSEWLALPETVYELSENYLSHGCPGNATASGGEPGLHVPDSFARLLETGASHLAAAKAAFVEQSRAAAVQARELAAFAALRPADLLDRPDDEVGAAAAASRSARPSALTDVSEWAVDEVMATLGLPSRPAGDLLCVSVTLVALFPATLAALEAGSISWAHARVMVDQLGGLCDERRQEVEAGLLAKAPGRTAAQLREAARRAVLRADASAAAKRLAQALRDRSVRMHSDKDGMASLTAMMSAPVTRACYRRLEALAEACTTPGDERTKDQRMSDCLADLLLSGQSASQPPVQVTLTVVASAATLTGGDEPGEVDGDPVSALQVREMAYALGLLPRPITAHGPTAVSPGEQAAADLGALLGIRTTKGAALAAPPNIAVVDEISGELRALTDAFEVRRIAACRRRACRSGRRPCTHPPSGPGLGPPRATHRYRPSAPLDQFVRARDRRCRFPGCRARPMRCDLDHVVPWAAGPTSASNLCCLCRHHHRLSHQAPAGRCAGSPTALSNGPFRAETDSSPTRFRTAPTTCRRQRRTTTRRRSDGGKLRHDGRRELPVRRGAAPAVHRSRGRGGRALRRGRPGAAPPGGAVRGGPRRSGSMDPGVAGA